MKKNDNNKHIVAVEGVHPQVQHGEDLVKKIKQPKWNKERQILFK